MLYSKLVRNKCTQCYYNLVFSFIGKNNIVLRIKKKHKCKYPTTSRGVPNNNYYNTWKERREKRKKLSKKLKTRKIWLFWTRNKVILFCCNLVQLHIIIFNEIMNVPRNARARGETSRRVGPYYMFVRNSISTIDIQY